ncbi:MAG: YjbQ family protein [Phycisphaerae bacterium]
MSIVSLTVATRQRNQFVDVTADVQRAVRDAGLRNGYAICFVPHTTAGITIQENADPDVVHDVLWKLGELIPKDEPSYRHAEGNSDAHIKSSLVGCCQTVLVEDGQLVLGTWQGLYFCEFDGPRNRRLLVRCVEA